MDVPYMLSQLQASAGRIDALARGVPSAEARWRPAPDAWSLLEVICHLADEEREDFRVRLDLILHDPGRPWPPIDPAGWVTARDYNARDLSESLGDFLSERAASLRWLDSLDHLDLAAVCESPFGVMRAGDMLAAWAAHDQLHLRQLVELHYLLTVERAAPYGVEYAGEW